MKILAIGNSFSDDCTAFLSDVATAQGESDWIVGNLYIGGCSLETHWENAKKNAKAYEYRKYRGGDFTNTPETSLSEGLADEVWDVITMQQASGDSGIAESYGALRELFPYVVRAARGAKILWNMTWSYAPESDHPHFSRYGCDSERMYRAIVQAVRSQIEGGSLAFDGIIPTGSAVESARLILGDSLTRDGYHLSDTGRRLAALTWYRALTGRLAVRACAREEEGLHETLNGCVLRAFDAPWGEKRKGNASSPSSD